MPHGDLSDFTGVTLLATGLQQIFWPSLSFVAVGPLAPFLSGGFDKAAPETIALLKFMGSMMIVIACMLIPVWWDRINGKMPAVACLGAAANIFYTTFTSHGSKVVPCVAYLYVLLMVLTAIHLLFLDNGLQVGEYLAAAKVAPAKKA